MCFCIVRFSFSIPSLFCVKRDVKPQHNQCSIENFFTVIEFGVKVRGCNGKGCFGIEVRVDTVELTNMIIAVFGET